MNKNSKKLLSFFLLVNLGSVPAYSYNVSIHSELDRISANPLNHLMVETAEAYEKLAINFAELGLINEASASNHTAIKILKNLGNEAAIAERFYTLGNTYLASGNNREALKYYYAAYRIAERSGSIANQCPIYLRAIASVYEKQGQESLAQALQMHAEKLLQNFLP